MGTGTSNSLLVRSKTQSGWLAAVFIAIFCIPSSNARIQGTIQQVWYLCTFAGFFYAYILFFQLRLWEKRSLYPIWVNLLVSLVSTVLNGTSLAGQVKTIYFVFASCVLVEYLLKVKEKAAYDYIAGLFAVLMILQALSALIGGMGYGRTNNAIYVNYFFGLRVQISVIWVYFIAIGSLCLVDARKKSKKLAFLIILGLASGVYFMFYESVSTAIVSFFVFFITLILTYIIRKEQVWRIALVALVIFVLAFVTLIVENNPFSWLLVDILGEGLTLNGRTIIWQQAIESLEGWHWLLGNGHGHEYRFFTSASWNTGSAHSQYLQTLTNFGLVGLAAYIWSIAFQIKQIGRQNSPIYKRLMMAAVTAIIITGIPMVTYNPVYYYICYVLIVNGSKHLVQQY